MFYFGTPSAGSSYDWDRLPIWADHGASHFYYGIPASQYRGFKIADDTRGPDFDPTDGERVPAADALARARTALAHRFPAMTGAPLIEARVCQYEQTPDSDFIVDHHPLAANVWIIGGGSGHGFKHGPALGEHAAERVLGEQPVEPTFSLRRFAR
jgi:glycine/D-amino acid oxidase-like deaminating enzyme